MILRKYYYCLIFSFLASISWGQMQVDGETLYGNEWMEEGQTYYRFKVGSDGIYRITYENLLANGIPVDQIAGDAYQVFSLGQEQAIYISAGENNLTEGDYIEFLGKKNRSELDRHLFNDPEAEMLNPEIGLFGDSSIYFLTWNQDGPNRRTQALELSDNNQPSQDWYWHNELSVQQGFFFQKRYLQNLVTYSTYDEAEGLASNRTNLATFQLSGEGYIAGLATPKLHLRLASDRDRHHLQVRINGNLVINDSAWVSYQMREYEISLDESLMQDEMEVEIKGVLGTRDWYRIATLGLTYPKAWETPEEGSGFYRLPSINTNRQVSLIEEAQESPLLIYSEAGKRARLTSPSPIQLSSADSEDRWYLQSEDDIKTIGTLEMLSIDPLDLSNTDYLIITNKVLLEGAQNYAAYRASVEGGSRQVQIITVDQLYLQYGYGHEFHPIAFRNMINDQMRSNPEIREILLLGKGLDYTITRNGVRSDVNLVPTFGSPGSDNLMFAAPGKVAALIPVGRVSARNNAEINLYLEKVKDYESQLSKPRTYENHAWKKTMIHLVGGNVSEQPIFDAQMRFMEAQVAETKLSADVTTNVKLSSEAVPTSVADQIIQRVNNGVLIKSFLGHGSVVVTGFGLDDPSIFDHNGRYSLDFAFGCLTGNTFTPQTSVSERFVLTPKSTGSISYIASSGYGYPYTLGRYGGLFYELLGTSHYNSSIGDILNTVIDSLYSNRGAPNISLSHQLNLQGDPAVPMFIEDAPDYVLDYSSVKLNPGIVTTDADSLELSFRMANIGTWVEDSITLRIAHTLPTDTVLNYDFRVYMDQSIDEFELKFPLVNESVGAHNVNIIVDPVNEFREFAAPEGESNNELSNPDDGTKGLNFFMLEDGVDPVFPINYGVVQSDQVTLQAVGNDLFGVANYILEVDTLETFSSTFKKEKKYSQQNNLIEWPLDFSLEPGKVYYWRIAIEKPNVPYEEYLWSTNSFLYKPNSSVDWNQSHYQQFDNGSLNRLSQEEGGELVFDAANFSVVLEAIARSEIDGGNSRLLLNNFRIQVARSSYGQIGVKVFDPVNGTQWTFPRTGRNDNILDVNRPGRNGRELLIQLLQEAPTGSYITLFTYAPIDESRTVYSQDWEQDSITYGTNIFQLLEAQGAVSSRLLKEYPRGPYVFAYQKDVGPIGEDFAVDGRPRARAVFDLPAVWPNASFNSDWVGPAERWQSLDWSIQKEANDSLVVSLFGQQSNGSTSLLLDDIKDRAIDLSNINAADFPFLRLHVEMIDSVDRTAPQIDYLRFTYEQPANIKYSLVDFVADTLNRGEQLELNLNAINFGESQGDSLQLSFGLRDRSNQQKNIPQTFPPVPGGAQNTIEFTYDSKELLGGDANLTISESISATEKNQLLAAKAFYVRDDRIPPVLSVSFDGRRIINRELISPRPFIRISLKDNNPFLLLQDTANFQAYLTDPNQVTRRLNVSDNDVIFIAANKANQNEASIEFTPELSVDGIYRLQVNARDQSGNEAGELDYEIEFEVITANQLSNLLPYPNPFSTQTKFVYTLTGSTPPSQFLLQIMTPSGRIVREVDQTEFGDLKVGTHQSEFTWDGTDNWGDQLANGVYLYRLIVKDAQGADFEKIERADDPYFKKGFGKLVILR